LASSLAWLPTLVALDHADDDHLHVVCSVEDGAAVYRVPRPLIFRHDAQPLILAVGEEAQMLMCDGLGYACDVWAKVVVKRVWDEGFAVVTICAQQLDVIAETVMDYNGVRHVPALLALFQKCLRSDSMLPMHHDLSFSSLLSEVVPTALRCGLRTPCCRGRSMRTSARIPGRIGDIAPDSLDSAFLQQSMDSAAAEEQSQLHTQQVGAMSGGDNIMLHSLEIDIVRLIRFDARVL
jgi:hypothetical protein